MILTCPGIQREGRVQVQILTEGGCNPRYSEGRKSTQVQVLGREVTIWEGAIMGRGKRNHQHTSTINKLAIHSGHWLWIRGVDPKSWS